MKKLLVVADVSWWVFDKIYRALKKYLNDWEVDVHYIKYETKIDHNPYSTVLYLCDYKPEILIDNKIPSEKVVLAIRSAVTHPFYDGNIEKYAEAIAVSNKELETIFKQKHNNVFLAPGGVDTDLFKPGNKKQNEEVRVGWSGSSNNFGREYRGLHIIEQACNELSYNFDPAIREVKLRNEEEMVDYYNSLDVYVDMSIKAGRQNGILEAGSCCVPVIASRSGIAEDLINGENGMICDRNVEDLIVCLQNINKSYGEKLRETIIDKWSWKTHAKYFENIFNFVIEEQ